MAEREILEKSIKEHQAAIDKANKELAKLDNAIDAIDDNGSLLGDIATIKTKLGNIFDDLKRNSEDLREFEVIPSGCDRHGFAAKLGCSCILMGEIGDPWFFCIDEAIEVHQKLGQLIATAKRKQKNE